MFLDCRMTGNDHVVLNENLEFMPEMKLLELYDDSYRIRRSYATFPFYHSIQNRNILEYFYGRVAIGQKRIFTFFH